MNIRKIVVNALALLFVILLAYWLIEVYAPAHGCEFVFLVNIVCYDVHKITLELADYGGHNSLLVISPG
jgi:hypothetical protein